MSEFIFNGRKIVEPGVYAQVKSGVNNSPLNLTYGNVLVIDKAATSFHGNGSAIAGEFKSGNQALYSFETITKFREFVGGGVFYDLAEPLFRPFGSGSSGVSTLHYARALTTVAASLQLTLDAGDITFKCKNEGLSGNGVLVSTELTRGYSLRLEAGVQDPLKFRFRFFRGTFKGNDPILGQAYDDISEADSKPNIIAQSPEVETIEEFVQWTTEDRAFIDNFAISAGADVTGDLVTADVTAYSAHQVFAGGTSTYATARIDDILAAIKDKNINFILTTDSGADAGSVDNVKIAVFLDTIMPDPADLFIPGGNTSGTFVSQSITTAKLMNSQNVTVVHGGPNITNVKSPIGLREKDVLYKTAAVLGRIAGLAPQTPGTFKGISIAGELHDLDSDERVKAIQGGVLATVYDENLGFHRILQAVNTIQQNRNVVNSDGTSSSISVVRIAKQLVKEMKINAIIDLLGDQENGPNRATLDAETVRTWAVSFLKKQEATPTSDDIIIDSRDVVVVANQDAWEISFGFTPNYEVNKMFITARILDSANAN